MPVYESGHFEDVVKEWEETAEIDSATLNDIARDPDQFVKEQLEWVDEAEEGADQFTRLVRVIGFVNAATTQRMSLLRQLEKWVKKLVGKLGQIARKWGCQGFAVGAQGFPPSIYVEVQF